MPSKKITSMTKKQFLKMPNSEIDKLSFKDAQYLMGKFMPEVGKGEDDMLQRRKGGMTMKKKGYAHGGAMSKRMGHTDYRKGGMFK